MVCLSYPTIGLPAAGFSGHITTSNNGDQPDHDFVTPLLFCLWKCRAHRMHNRHKGSRALPCLPSFLFPSRRCRQRWHETGNPGRVVGRLPKKLGSKLSWGVDKVVLWYTSLSHCCCYRDSGFPGWIGYPVFSFLILSPSLARRSTQRCKTCGKGARAICGTSVLPVGYFVCNRPKTAALRGYFLLSCSLSLSLLFPRGLGLA